MITAAVLILFGILILIFPTLLSVVVALFLIISGIVLAVVAYEFRRNQSTRNTRLIRIILNN